ncbi:MAG: alpha/beta hydrolase [Solirubrobacterales bacterium]
MLSEQGSSGVGSSFTRRIAAKRGDSRRTAAAVFVHGLGTTDRDLQPVAAAFAEQGIHALLLTLAGHDEGEAELPDVTVAGWLDQVRDAVDAALASHDAVYLVGFSLGAALALRVATERDLAGVLCVSTFARPAKHRWLVKAALLFPRFPPVGSRRPRTSVKATRLELRWRSKLPTPILKRVIEEAPQLSAVPRRRRVLFVHSVNDPVASYSAVAELVQGAASSDVRLITLSGLAHFVQFDVSPHALCGAALAHFHPDGGEPDRRHPAWIENVRQREDEVRHWANVLSLLFLGFFTVFGTLAKATLPEIAAKDPSAPYLLFAYVLLIAVYLQFAFLNFFYMNRTQAYLRIYVDPLQESGVGWTFYRTDRWASGRASRRMTRFVASSGTLLPLLMALAAIGYAFATYHDRLFDLISKNLGLQALALLAVCWLVQVAYTGFTLVRYTNVHLYRVPPMVPASRKFLLVLRDLYASAQPGIVNGSAGRLELETAAEASTSAVTAASESVV